jgi:hypothetical protein
VDRCTAAVERAVGAPLSRLGGDAIVDELIGGGRFAWRSNSSDLYPQFCFLTESSTCEAYLTLLRSLEPLIAAYLLSRVLPMETLLVCLR